MTLYNICVPGFRSDSYYCSGNTTRCCLLSVGVHILIFYFLMFINNTIVMFGKTVRKRLSTLIV